jgi:hypothetical protein
MRNLLYAVDCAYVVEGIDRGREASVKAEYLSQEWVRTPFHMALITDLEDRLHNRGQGRGMADGEKRHVLDSQ